MAQPRPTRRRQKASATATPAVSTKSLTPAPSDPAQLPSRCTRRSASRLSTPVNSREKIPIKEEPEARILRTRPSSHVDRNEPLSIAIHVAPVGPDGQPLPTCVTCHNILPMISVDNQIVWGLNFDTTPRRGKKRKEPQECPRYVEFSIHLEDDSISRCGVVTRRRCMRHFAIYAHSWPARLASQVVVPVPRDDGESSSRRPTQKNVPAMEPKHAAGSEERPAKRRKTDQGPIVEMSDKAKELLLAPKRKRGRPRKHPMTEEIPKRKRGRPRKSSPARLSRALPPSKSQTSTPTKTVRPRISPPASVRSRSEPGSPSSSRGVLKPKSLAVKSQPRDSNGRFGKKATTNGRYVRKRFGTMRSGSTRAQRVLQRARVERWLGDKQEQLETNDEAEELHVLASGKRGRASTPDDSPRPSKILRSSPRSADGDEDPAPRNPNGSSLLRFRGLNAGLLCRPNPTNFARRTWAPPLAEDASPDDEDAEGSLPTIESESNGPVTPQDRTPLPIPSPDQLMFQGKPSLESKIEEAASRLPTPRHSTHSISTILTFKPSPINFARRRWSSTTKSPLESGNGTRRSQRLRPRSSLPDENNLSLPTSQTEISPALSTRTTLAGRSVSPQKSTTANDAAQPMSEAATETVRIVSRSFHIHRIE